MLSGFTTYACTHTHTHTHTQVTKQLWKMLLCVYYLDCDNGITGVCICSNLSNSTQNICTVLDTNHTSIK